MPARPEESEETADSLDEGAVRNLVGYNLKRAYIAIHTPAQAAVAALDLRIPTFSCLSVIVQNPGITPSVLAETLKMERSNIVVVIDELESRDLVSRTQMKTDRRRYQLRATVRGRRLHDRAVEAIGQAEDRLLLALDDGERTQLLALLKKIEAAARD